MIKIIVIVEIAIIIQIVETAAGTAGDIVREIVHAVAVVQPVHGGLEDALAQQVLWARWVRLVRLEQWG